MGKPEATVENYLKKKSEEQNCICYKFVSPSNSGVPDRIIIKPNGTTVYVELKAKEGHLSELQKEVIRELQKQKAPVFVIDTKQGVLLFLNYIFGKLSEIPPEINPVNFMNGTRKPASRKKKTAITFLQ